MPGTVRDRQRWWWVGFRGSWIHFIDEQKWVVDDFGCSKPRRNRFGGVQHLIRCVMIMSWYVKMLLISIDFNITEPSFGTPFMNPTGLVDVFGSGRVWHPETKRYPSVMRSHVDVENSPFGRNRWTIFHHSCWILFSPKRRLRIEKLSRSFSKGSSFRGFLGRCFAIKRIQSHRNGRPQTLHVRKKTTKTKKKENGWKWPKTSKTVLNGQPFSPLRLTAKSRVVSGQIHQPRLPRWIVGVTRWGGRLDDVWKVVNASWQ